MKPLIALHLAVMDNCQGSHHNLMHLTKVHALARLIGQMEGLDSRTQEILEAAALIHDIACPALRKRLGKAPWDLQELEGPPLAEEAMRFSGFDQDAINRVSFLVAHHHQWDKVDGMDYQILLEADFLVNAQEKQVEHERARRVAAGMFKTQSGLALLDLYYPTVT